MCPMARAGIGNRTVTDVIRQILTDEEIVGIVDALIGFTVGIGTGVNRIEHAKAAFQRPGRIVEGIFHFILFIALDFQIAERRVREEDAIAVQILARMRYAQAEIGADVPQAADAEALIGGVIEIFLDQRGIVRIDKGDARQIGSGLETGTVGADRNTVGADRTGGAETRALTRRARAGDIVDIATLAVVIDHAAEGEILRDRQVDDGFDIAAHVTVLGEGGPKACGRLKLANDRGVGDHANRAGLRAGTVERALWSGQDFDAIDVGCVDIEIAAGLAQWLLIKIEGHIRSEAGDAGCCQVRCRRSEAADVDRVLSRAGAASGDARELLQVVGEDIDAQFFERAFAHGVDCDRNRLGAGFPLCRGHRDGFHLRRGNAGRNGRQQGG